MDHEGEDWRVNCSDDEKYVTDSNVSGISLTKKKTITFVFFVCLITLLTLITPT